MTTPTQAQIEAARAEYCRVIAKAVDDRNEVTTQDGLDAIAAALTAAAQVGGQGKVKTPATIEELDAILNAPEENLTIANCSKCGGTHFGSHECPIELEKERTNATIERCAQVADRMAWSNKNTRHLGPEQNCVAVAAAIRKLKDEPAVPEKCL